MDVTDEDAVQKAVGEILSEAGGIDVVVNCAGFGISGVVEFTALDQAKAQFDVNFFGTVKNKAVLPSMREAGKGHTRKTGIMELQYKHNEKPEEDYIDLVPILQNLYFDVDKFLNPIKGVEVANG